MGNVGASAGPAPRAGRRPVHAAVPARGWGVDRGAWGRRGRSSTSTASASSESRAIAREIVNQVSASSARSACRAWRRRAWLGRRGRRRWRQPWSARRSRAGSDTADRSATERVDGVDRRVEREAGRGVEPQRGRVAGRRVQRHRPGIAGGVDPEGQPTTVQLGHLGQRDLLVAGVGLDGFGPEDVGVAAGHLVGPVRGRHELGRRVGARTTHPERHLVAAVLDHRDGERPVVGGDGRRRRAPPAGRA